MKGLWVKKEGQTLVLFTLFLVVLLGMAALAIDVGYLYFARTSFQRAADAGCLAGGSGITLSQAEAASRAIEFAGYNLTGSLSGATTSVSFPTADTIRVDVGHSVLPLFFGPVVGWPTAPVRANASCSLQPVGSVSEDAVPLGIYCNNPAGCNGALAVGPTYSIRRYCGNFFDSGPNGSTCGNLVAPGEVFLIGLTFSNSNSNADFRREVYQGLDRIVTLTDVVGALPGNRNGWRDGMENRLAEGRNEMIFFGVRPAAGDDDRNSRRIQIIDFFRVRVLGFSRQGNTDRTTFQILRVVMSTTLFGTDGQGNGADSILGVRLIE